MVFLNKTTRVKFCKYSCKSSLGFFLYLKISQYFYIYCNYDMRYKYEKVILTKFRYKNKYFTLVMIIAYISLAISCLFSGCPLSSVQQYCPTHNTYVHIRRNVSSGKNVQNFKPEKHSRLFGRQTQTT